MAFDTSSACTSHSIWTIFHMPCANDASVGILQEIFGNQVAALVGGVLSPQDSLIPHFISNFNTVLLSGALLLYAVIIIVGAINTGHHGKFLGQQWDSIWTPIRVIGGTALMVPLKYGFTAAQIIVLSLLLYGVHIATTVWYNSVEDVQYGTPPTVPASGQALIKQAIANDIIMETYKELNGSFPAANSTTHLNGSTINFFSAQAAPIQAKLTAVLPAMCEAALADGTANPDGTWTVTDPVNLTGQAAIYYTTCQQVTQDFMQQAKQPFYLDVLSAKSAFQGHSGYPAFWVGNDLPGISDCMKQMVNGSDPLVSDQCFQKFYNNNMPYFKADTYNYPYQKADGTMDSVDISGSNQIAYHQYNSVNFSPLTTPQSASGNVSVDAAIKFYPGDSTNTAQKKLQEDIDAFVMANITNPSCLSLPAGGTNDPYPAPTGCSNNIDTIIQAFNNYLASGFPQGGYTLQSSTDVPTASKNPLIPGTNTALNSSWWNAGEVYLIIDQQMAKNLSDMLAKLAQLTQNSGLPHFGMQETMTTGFSMSLSTYWQGTGVDAQLIGLGNDASAIVQDKEESTDASGLWAGYVNQFKSSDPTIYNALNNLPGSNTLALFMLSKSATAKEGDKGKYIFTRLFQVMATNNMLDSGDFSSTLPVKNAMDKIFEGLLGSGSGSQVGASINSLMSEVYNLGVVDNNDSFIGKNLSVIQSAQRTGIDMIVTTINSIESVYSHYETEYKDLRTKVQNIGIGTTASAAGLSALAIASGLAGPFGAARAAAFGAASEMTAQAGQMAIQITTMLKMSDILQSLMWLPIVIVVLTALFTAGVSFALMLPLMPFILFWAGQIAWILGCLEAVIAAPFLAWCLILPGGHHFAGHTVPGLRMLLGIIFRPVLMVLGLLIGLVLTYIVIAFSADAFHVVAITLIGGKMGNTTYAGIMPASPYYQDARGVIACLMLFLYCSFLMLAFQKCFSPIYLLPEKVTQMMGGQADKAGEQDLQQLQQGVSQQSQSLAQSGGQGLNKGIEAQQQKTQSKSRAWESGSGASSSAYGKAKTGLYDKGAWKNAHQSESKSAGLTASPQGPGSGGGGMNPSDPAQNPALQGGGQSPKPKQD